MPTPTWSAAATGGNTQSGQINQFLVAHTATFAYDNTIFNTPPAINTSFDSFSSTNSSLIYRFTTPTTPTQLTRVALALGVVGSGCDVTMTLQGDNGTRANGTVLSTITIPGAWLSASTPTDVAPNHGFILNHLLASTEYAYYNIVLTPATTFDSTHNIAVYHTTATTAGTAWLYNSSTATYTAQTYGYYVKMYTSTTNGTTGYLRCVSEDSGAMIKGYDYATNGNMTTARQWTQATSGTNPASSRTLTFTNGLLTSVS
jgi:hypothetical protein